jgi:glycerol-3-phosphate dehydrogenase
VAGGKFTTHRAIAQKIVDDVMRSMGRPAGVCPTLATPLPGARGSLDLTGVDSNISDDIARMLASRYGTRAELVAEIVHERPEMATQIVPRRIRDSRRGDSRDPQ